MQTTPTAADRPLLLACGCHQITHTMQFIAEVDDGKLIAVWVTTMEERQSIGQRIRGALLALFGKPIVVAETVLAGHDLAQLHEWTGELLEGPGEAYLRPHVQRYFWKNGQRYDSLTNEPALPLTNTIAGKP